jgi:hypothetical protein
MPVGVFDPAVSSAVESLLLWLMLCAVDHMAFSSLMCSSAFGCTDKLLSFQFLATAGEEALRLFA